MFNGLPEESNNVEKSTNVETVQSMGYYVGEMPGKEKYPEVGAINIETVQSMGYDVGKVPGKEKQPDVGAKTGEGINYVNPIEGKNGKNAHVPARVVPTRVSDQAKCVLPAWTRKCRPATPGPSKPTEKIIRKKREHVNTDDHVELFSKRL